MRGAGGGDGRQDQAQRRAAADAVATAAGPLHHLALGPGPALTAEWVAAGLELPDLRAMRRYRLDRILAEPPSPPAWAVRASSSRTRC